MNPVITVEQISMRYGDQVTVDDISFTVERGDIFVSVGLLVVCLVVSRRTFRWS